MAQLKLLALALYILVCILHVSFVDFVILLQKLLYLLGAVYSDWNGT